MAIGSVAAITQTNIKRLMAYSSIAHMGFALMGLAAGTTDGVQSMLLYMAIYITMNIGSFAFIMSMEREGRPVLDIASLSMLSKRDPVRAMAFMVLLFSMAGVPPMLGFFAKWGVLFSAVESELYWLAIAGVITSVVAAYYYIRIIYLMYFGADIEPLDADRAPVLRSFVVATALVMVFGIFNFFGVERPQLVMQHRVQKRRAAQDLGGEEPALARHVARHLQLAPHVGEDLLQRLALGRKRLQRVEPGFQQSRQQLAVDRFLAVEIVDDVLLREPRGAGDLFQRGAAQPLFREHVERRLEDRPALLPLDPGGFSGAACAGHPGGACLSSCVLLSC